MAIMQRCCCCDVRQGSIACGIYCMIIAIIGVIYFGIDITGYALLVSSGFSGIPIINAFFASDVIALIVFVFMIVACILVIVGVVQDKKEMLIPFMVAKSLHFIWYLYYFILLAIFLGASTTYSYVYLGAVIVVVPFAIGDIVCLLCVVSQYQELAAGRGKAGGHPNASNQTTVVIQQQMAPPAYNP